MYHSPKNSSRKIDMKDPEGETTDSTTVDNNQIEFVDTLFESQPSILEKPLKSGKSSSKTEQGERRDREERSRMREKKRIEDAKARISHLEEEQKRVEALAREQE